MPSLTEAGCTLANLKTLHCPNCKRRLTVLRIPEELRSLMWGGWTCPGCKCQMDHAGKPLKSTTDSMSARLTTRLS